MTSQPTDLLAALQQSINAAKAGHPLDYEASAIVCTACANTTTRTYIAGPMTGLPDYNRPAFHAAAARMRAAGGQPINPARDEGREGCSTWEDYMRAALRDIADADAMLMLDGWQTSRGARMEHAIATALGIPVAYDAANTAVEATP